jgi:hypothetical protein
MSGVEETGYLSTREDEEVALVARTGIESVVVLAVTLWLSH